MTYFWITITVLTMMGGNLLLRAGMVAVQYEAMQTLSVGDTIRRALINWQVWSGALLIVTGFIAWVLLLVAWQMEWSYTALGLSFIATIVLAWWFLGETLTLEKMFGAIIMVIGLLLLVRYI